MKVEKNNVSIGTCTFPTPLLDKPLFAAVDLWNSDISLVLVSDSAESPLKPGTLCWDTTRKPNTCTLSTDNLTAIKCSGKRIFHI